MHAVVDVVVDDREDRAIDQAVTERLTITAAVVVTFGPVGSTGEVALAVAVAVVQQLVQENHRHSVIETVAAPIHPVTPIFLDMAKIMRQTFIMSILNGSTRRFHTHINDTFIHKQQV